MTDNTDLPDVDLPDADLPEVDLPESVPVPVPAPAGQIPNHGFFTRLYTGTGAFEVVGRRKMWFGISFLIVGIAIASIVLRGFTFGIDFEKSPKDGDNVLFAFGILETKKTFF